MIIYEVTISVPQSLADAFSSWLAAHIDDMVALTGFIDAQRFRVEDPDRSVWCVHYRLVDRAALDAYLERHAASMRQQGRNRFGDQLQASRRLLTPA